MSGIVLKNVTKLFGMKVEIQKNSSVITLRNIATISFTWSLDSFFFKFAKLMNENRHGILLSKLF